MFGYFGQQYFGGADFGGGTITGPTGPNILAADSATISDWDVDVSGLGQDETAAVSESALTVGIDTPAQPSQRTAADNASLSESAISVGTDNVPPPPPPPPPPPAFVQRSVIRFVDSVSSSAAMRMDLESSLWTVLFDGTKIPPPPMEDQRTSSMTVDGELITASAYRNRIITLHLLLAASSPDEAARQIQQLQRELDRPENVLWWQPDINLPPQFAITYRGPDISDQVLDWGTRKHEFTIEIEAEPMLLGERTDLGSFTVNFNPAAGSNPCWFDLPTIHGDVDTPLYMTTSSSWLSGTMVAFATRRRGNPNAVTWFRQAEDPGLAGGVDGSIVTLAAASAGAYRRISFASTAGSAVRLSGLFPGSSASGSVDWKGTYRAFARARSVTPSTDAVLQVATSVNASSLGQRSLVDPWDTGNWVLTDLGLVDLPAGNNGRRAGYGLAHPTAGSPLYFYAERGGGSGVLDMDYLFLCPADEYYALVQMPVIPGGGDAVIDGVAGEVYARNSSGALTAAADVVAYVDGSLPEVSPVAPINRVFVLPGINGVGSENNTASAATFAVSYWPKYRVARPVSA